MAIFFFASAGASAAYLTVSEIFPMETRALSIAFFYAVGTAIGGITGPLLFGPLIDSGDPNQLFYGYLLGAVLMIGGGIVEAVLGVKAEGQSLENIAKPLTAEEAEAKTGPPAGGPGLSGPRGAAATSMTADPPAPIDTAGRLPPEPGRFR